jgi:hypothetical protein
MTLHDLSDVAVIAQVIIASVAAVFVYIQIKGAHNDNIRQIEAQREENKKQIEAQRDENKKWKTLDICAQYEFSQTVSAAAANVKTAYQASKPDAEKCKGIAYDANIILNYLDGIAIGVKQGLYIEWLARDHLEQIVKFYVDKVLQDCERLHLNVDDFHFITEMATKWKENKTYYCDKS